MKAQAWLDELRGSTAMLEDLLWEDNVFATCFLAGLRATDKGIGHLLEPQYAGILSSTLGHVIVAGLAMNVNLSADELRIIMPKLWRRYDDVFLAPLSAFALANLFSVSSLMLLLMESPSCLRIEDYATMAGILTECPVPVDRTCLMALVSGSTAPSLHQDVAERLKAAVGSYYAGGPTLVRAVGDLDQPLTLSYRYGLANYVNLLLNLPPTGPMLYKGWEEDRESNRGMPDPPAIAYLEKAVSDRYSRNHDTPEVLSFARRVL